MDGNDCGKRYLCEVGTVPQEMRNKQEKATMDLFQVLNILEITRIIKVLRAPFSTNNLNL